MQVNVIELKILFVWLFIISFPSCDNNHVSNEGASGKSDIESIDLLNKTYLFGPSIDSTTFTVEANCDCCTSNLAFFRDSTFIYISYCLEGDNCSKGKFSVYGKELSLHFDSLSVTQSFGFVADTSYEVTRVAPRTSTVQTTRYKSKPLLIYEGEGVIEYGIEEGSINRILKG